MRLVVILLLFFFAPSLVLAAIYQSVDENGNITFSDKPTKGSFERKIKEPPVMKMESPSSTDETEKPVSESPQVDNTAEKKEAKKYRLFSIKSPQDKEAVRENNGNVTVKLNLQPELQKTFGHYIKVSLDNKLLSEKYTSSSIVLDNLDRGAHQLSATVYDKEGKLLIKTPDITFYLQRYSALFRKN